LALIAVTASGEIGVDVERVRVLEDFDELVARFFSKREMEEFRRLEPEEQPAAFFNLWTRKEAWLKATGEGILHSLKNVEVSFLPGEPPRFLNLPTETGHTSGWDLRELSPGPGFTGALATSGGITRVECRRWGDEKV
jgi:4'-phosphopantetheinyl transferase